MSMGDMLPKPAPRGPGELVWPLPSAVPFWRDTIGSGRPRMARPNFPRHHAGVDIKSTVGRGVVAMQGGKVRRMGWTKTTDALVVDDGISATLHGGLDPDQLTTATHVKAGDPLGVTGRGYGEWLHIEVRRPGAALTQRWFWGKPPPAAILDPRPYLDAAAQGTGMVPERPVVPSGPKVVPPPPSGPLTPIPPGGLPPLPGSGPGPGAALLLLLAGLAASEEW